MRTTARLIAVAAVVLSAACDRGAGPAAPSGTGAAGPVRIETFTGTLQVGNSNFYSFPVGNAGNVYVTLISLSASGTLQTTRVGLGLGIPAATNCQLDIDNTAVPSSAAQVAGFVVPGTYCARISDIGNLTESLAFTINIAYPR